MNCDERNFRRLLQKRDKPLWLQIKDQVSCARYIEKRSIAIRDVRDAKGRPDERWGEEVTENSQKSIKMFWKEMKRIRKGDSGKKG